MVRPVAEKEGRRLDSVAARTLPVRIFVMGANHWRDEQEWPLRPRTCRRAFYLASRGHANTLAGDGRLESPRSARRPAADRFVFDPRNPVPTTGGAVCCNPKVFPWGPMDQRPVEKRRDVLVYTSAPLRKDLEVIGPVHVVLYAATPRRIPTSRPSWWMCFRMARRGTSPTVSCGCATAIRSRSRELTAGRAKSANHHRRRRHRQRLSEGPPRFAWKFRAAIFRASTAIRIPAARSPTPRELRKATQTIYHDHGGTSCTCFCRWWKIDFVRLRRGIFQVGRSKRRGSQVVRQGSAKPLFVGSIPPRASRRFAPLTAASLRNQAPAATFCRGAPRRDALPRRGRRHHAR